MTENKNWTTRSQAFKVAKEIQCYLKGREDFNIGRMYLERRKIMPSYYKVYVHYNFKTNQTAKLRELISKKFPFTFVRTDDSVDVLFK